MQKQINQVKKFHEVFGAGILNSPTIPNADRVELRVRLITEEAQELIDGLNTGNLLEVCDGACDLLYVLLGTVLECGLQHKFEEMFDEVQRSNMSKTDANGKAILREDGKVLKSEFFSKPDLLTILEQTSLTDQQQNEEDMLAAQNSANNISPYPLN